MTWQEIIWQIPLDAIPQALQMGVGIHGPNDVRRYRFEGLWILHLYCYHGKVLMDDQEFPIQPGYASIMPPGITSVTHFPDLSRHTYAHFALPPAEGDAVPIRAMHDLGEDFAALNHAFEQAVSYFDTLPRRAEVRLWDILWELAERTDARPSESSRRHPAVQRALQIIETRLADPVSVAGLAREVDLSHNHLTRLFQAAVGTTVIGYIQQRRAQRARHLLLYSTMPIKAVAAEVGVHDLHQFNKTIRRILGEAPRALRLRGPHG